MKEPACQDVWEILRKCLWGRGVGRVVLDGFRVEVGEGDREEFSGVILG